MGRLSRFETPKFCNSGPTHILVLLQPVANVCCGLVCFRDISATSRGPRTVGSNDALSLRDTMAGAEQAAAIGVT